MSDSSHPLASTQIGVLFDAAASTEPTPGGGCVSAVGGYFGISLLLKAIAISARRHPDEPSYGPAEARLMAAARELLQRAQADSDAFGLYVQALKLPKADQAEQALRQQAMRDASFAATQVAMDILEAGTEVLECAAQVRSKIASGILADVRACVEMIAAMNVVANENAAANLSGTADTPEAHTLRIKLDALFERQATLLRTCRSIS